MIRRSAQRLRLRPRVGATIEVESGSNDPFAVLLTIILVEFLLVGDRSWQHIATLLADSGQIVLVPAISPLAEHRELLHRVGELFLDRVGDERQVAAWIQPAEGDLALPGQQLHEHRRQHGAAAPERGEQRTTHFGFDLGFFVSQTGFQHFHKFGFYFFEFKCRITTTKSRKITQIFKICSV